MHLILIDIASVTQTKIKQRLISITKSKDCSNSLIGPIYMPAVKGPFLC